VELINPICLQQTHLLGGYDAGYDPTLVEIVFGPFEHMA